jgi:hypothetical protein
MKQVAYLQPKPNATPITIWQVRQELEKDPANWERRQFYSLVNHRPMKANFGTMRAWHFAFQERSRIHRLRRRGRRRHPSSITSLFT